MSWQGLVGTAGIVAGTLARIVAQEHAARIHHLLGKLLVIGSCDDKMLWGVGVAEVDGLLLVLNEDELGVIQRSLRHLLARQSLQLNFHFLLHSFQNLFGSSDEEHL